MGMLLGRHSVLSPAHGMGHEERQAGRNEGKITANTSPRGQEARRQITSTSSKGLGGDTSANLHRCAKSDK